MSLPLVTAVIPCYNQGNYLAEAIQSCLAQTHASVDVIVVDDGSTDSTADVCAQYSKSIRVIRQPNSGLPAAARNAALSFISGDYVQFLDADDRIHPKKFEEQVAAMEREPEVGVVYSDGSLIDRVGERIGPAKINHPSGWVFHELLTMWGTQVAAVLVRKSCLDAVGPFSTDRAVRGCEDLDMWLRLAARYQFRSLPEDRFEYRVGGTSVSANGEMMLKSGLEVLRRHAKVHGDCADCRRAIRAGRRRWKDVAAFGFMTQARGLAEQREWMLAMAKVAAVVRHHPAHIWKLLRPRHVGTKLSLLRGSRATT